MGGAVSQPGDSLLRTFFRAVERQTAAAHDPAGGYAVYGVDAMGMDTNGDRLPNRTCFPAAEWQTPAVPGATGGDLRW
jgi:hypothetical protein